METPKINSENSLLNNSLNGLVAGLGMRTPVSMSSMKTTGGPSRNPQGLPPNPRTAQMPRSDSVPQMGTPITTRPMGGSQAPSTMPPLAANASGYGSLGKPGVSREFGSTPLDLASTFSPNAPSSSASSGNSIPGGQQTSGGRSSAGVPGTPTKGVAIDTTALKFLDSFALTDNTNGRKFRCALCIYKPHCNTYKINLRE
eukprot:876197-Prorocentrum_minimum.AAC.4